MQFVILSPQTLLPAGFPITREEVIRIVHIGESTLEKRVNEFAGTNASDFTAIEFEEHSKEFDKKEQFQLEQMESVAMLEGPKSTPEQGCEHLCEYLILYILKYVKPNQHFSRICPPHLFVTMP